MDNNEKKKQAIKVGLDSSGTAVRRQLIYESFSATLSNLGLNVELKQTGLMSINPDEVLVEISQPDGGHVYYGLATTDDVEHVVNRHLICGNIVTKLVIPDDEIGNFFVKRNDKAVQYHGVVKADINQWRESLNLIGMGWFLGLSIMAGVFGGLWLDSKLHTEPLLMLIGLILGIVIAFFGAYRMLSPLLKNRS